MDSHDWADIAGGLVIICSILTGTEFIVIPIVAILLFLSYRLT